MRTGIRTSAAGCRGENCSRGAVPVLAAWRLPGFWVSRRAARRGSRSVGDPGASFRTQGEASDFSVHARWTLASRHVRLQAAAQAGSWQAAALRASQGGLERDFQPAAVALGVPPVWTERDVGQRPVSRGGPVRRRSLLHKVHARLELAPRRRPARAAHRKRYVRAPQHGLVDYLRPGHREPEHARLHHDLSHSEPRRREQLQLGISAGSLRGNGDRRRRNSRAGGQDSVHYQQRDAARTSSGWSSTTSRR